MGAGLSGEDDEAEATPKGGIRDLNWLLSDANRVQEAFKPLWKLCDVDEQGCAPKATVMEVLLQRLVSSEAGYAVGSQTSATTKRLAYVADMMPDTLARQEALHLFRLALLALQAALVSQQAEGLAPWTVPAPKAHAPRPAGSLHDLNRATRSSPLGPSETADFVRTSRGYSKPDDTAMSAVNQRPAGRLPEPKFVLASRQELEVETEQLQRLSELITASAQEEASVVLALEEEVRKANAGRSYASSGLAAKAAAAAAPTSHEAELFKSLESKVASSEHEVQQLEATIADKDAELVTYEAEVNDQQAEMRGLLGRRAHEETTAELLQKETQDLHAELQSLRRHCTTTTTEIREEEKKAAELREAFENRRVRYMSIEAAAQSAEVTTEEAMRRRAVSSAAAHVERAALEEAEEARARLAEAAHTKVEALMAEIEEQKSQGDRLQALLRFRLNQ
mmetsp:Transcript_68884/g.128592  ORF Transcript_68884/g.128592 Transcript_68884/m.128592 type:complete len:452 (-) Transcript_68884:23-1378(-)